MAISPRAGEGGLASALVTALTRHEEQSTAHLGSGHVPSASSGMICDAWENECFLFLFPVSVYELWYELKRGRRSSEGGQDEDAERSPRFGLRSSEVISPDESRQRNTQTHKTSEIRLEGRTAVWGKSSQRVCIVKSPNVSFTLIVLGSHLWLNNPLMWVNTAL